MIFSKNAIVASGPIIIDNNTDKTITLVSQIQPREIVTPMRIQNNMISRLWGAANCNSCGR
jgi:hypothetical protein